MNAFTHLFDKVLSLVFSREAVSAPAPVVESVEEVAYPYIFPGIDNGYERVHPELALSVVNTAGAYRLPAGESRAVTFLDGTVAVVNYELISFWNEGSVYHLVTFEMYKEFIETVENF